VSEEGTGLVYERHFTREEANALLPQLTELLGQLAEAKDELTDSEAHEALSEAAPSNGVGVAFLEVRRLLETVERSGIVLRDIDRGLVDFPALLENQEVHLCWELGEDEVGYWHDLDGGYGGRQPLD
jgi:hypothetical protein